MSRCAYCSRSTVQTKTLLDGVLALGGVSACGLHRDRALRSLQVKRRGTFRETQHPRDRAGRFIEINAKVKIFGGGTGTVQRYFEGGRVDVLRDSDSKVVRLDSGYLTVIADAEGNEPGPRSAQRATPDSPNVPEDAVQDPDASPVGADLYWEAADGKIAWLTGDTPPQGFVRSSRDDAATTLRFDNLGAFMVWTSNNGLNDAGLQRAVPTTDPAGGTRPRPDGVANLAAPEADSGDTLGTFDPLEGVAPVSAGIDREQAASAAQVVGAYKEGLPDYEGFGAWHMAYGAAGREERDGRREAASVAKAQVVADLLLRMDDVADDDMLTYQDARHLEAMDRGEMTLLRTPRKRFDGSVIEGDFTDRFVPTAQFDALMAKDPDGLARNAVTVVDADTFRAEKRAERVNGLVQAWALGSSANGRSIVLHETVQEVFGLTETAEVDYHFGVSDRDVERAREEQVSMRAFVLAQYEATQDYFASLGITHVPVYRGHKVYDGGTPEWAVDAVDGGRGVADVTLRPLSSFSVDRSVAAQFARGVSTDESYIITGTVPVQRIFSTPRTGVGCLEEAEVVVLGGVGSWQVERSTEADGPTIDDEYDPMIDGPGPEGDVFYDEDDDEGSTDEQVINTPAGAIATRADLLAAIRLADTPERRKALTRRAASLGMSSLIPNEWGTGGEADTEGAVLSWEQVKQRYPAYAAYGTDHAVNELAHVADGEMVTPDLRFTEETVDLRTVKFQRYPADDERVQSLRQAREDNADVPPPLLVYRAGELLTADGHHRLSEMEAAGMTEVRALVAHSEREDRYKGLVALGTVAQPRKRVTLASPKT